MSDLRNLLKRIRQWDALDIPNSDGAYWKREIDTALAQQAEPQWCSCDPTRCEGMGRCRWQAMKYVPPAQQAERKPLTDEEIVHCLVAAKCVGTVNMSYDAGPYYVTRPSRAATWFARAIEAAHGITEGQR